MKYVYNILIVISPNLFWGILSFILNTNRIYINIDYFFPVLLYIYGRKTWAIVFFIFLNFFDFVNIFSQIFPFIRFGDLIYLVKFSLLSSWINFLIPVFFLFFICTYFALLNMLTLKIKKVFIFLIFNILLFLLVIQNYFFDIESNRLWKNDSKYIVQSQLLNAYELRSDGFIQGFSIEGDAFNDIKLKSASEDLFQVDDKRNKILLIVNESWGRALDSSINIDIVSDIIKNNLVEYYALSAMNVNGFTINAEIRELCQKDLKHFNLKNQIKGFENCLPNIYKKKGYHTYAMHGATGAMYDRKYWYPKVGFDALIFRDTVNNLNSRCYSFPGFCDRDLNQFVANAFREKNVFFYWLTLNTHVNYDLNDLKKDHFNCAKYNIENNSSSCRNLKLQKQFFYYLGELIVKPEMKGVDVIVVGDHEAPTYGENKTVFFENQVSILKFKVK